MESRRSLDSELERTIRLFFIGSAMEAPSAAAAAADAATVVTAAFEERRVEVRAAAAANSTAGEGGDTSSRSLPVLTADFAKLLLDTDVGSCCCGCGPCRMTSPPASNATEPLLPELTRLAFEKELGSPEEGE
jgi:hypothetical protein